jgi:hypothetical protein
MAKYARNKFTIAFSNNTNKMYVTIFGQENIKSDRPNNRKEIASCIEECMRALGGV